ncbi:MAG TPA: glyceraldehyde 3-phosphate dehydrogenase NAD-binding domain-containing protein, partial [Acidobacteriota bacterium]|nr:glyceraldehyde 3-phosphate dehydrogenase NAD-binding domain-containing protein [Acidobacteriota bacterium]
MKRVAIHGFGRIGRSTTRAALKHGLFVPVSISDITYPSTLAALFAYDSNYGAWPEPAEFKDGKFHIGDRQIPFFNSAKSLPNWKELEVDLVVDCTGRATKREGAQPHLDAGAKRVLVSAPSKSLQDCDAVLLPGINLEQFDPNKHRIVSMA